MDKIIQPHDKFFRATFGKADFSRDFLNNYLPKELVELVDMDTLIVQNTNYISKELKEQFTDLLYRTNINNEKAYILFLFEHKSYQDRMVIFQVLKYMIEIWEANIRNDLEARKEDSLSNYDLEIPIVIPMVVYHDRYKWNVKRTLGEMMLGFSNLPISVKKYIPDFEYMLIDLGYSDKEKKLDEEHSIVIKTLNKARYASKGEILDIFTEMITIYRKRKDRDMVAHYIIESMVYIISTRDDLDENELIEIAGQISEEGGDLVMTLADRLRTEGLEQGIEQGIEQGEIKAIRKNIFKVLSRNFKIDIIDNIIKDRIKDISDLDILNDLFDQAFEIKSVEEFEAILDELNK